MMKKKANKPQQDRAIDLARSKDTTTDSLDNHAWVTVEESAYGSNASREWDRLSRHHPHWSQRLWLGSLWGVGALTAFACNTK